MSSYLPKIDLRGKLDLDGSRIGDSGATELAGVLSESTIVKLRLHENEITDKGVKALAAALRTNSTIAELYLSYNKIGNSGVASGPQGRACCQ